MFASMCLGVTLLNATLLYFCRPPALLYYWFCIKAVFCCEFWLCFALTILLKLLWLQWSWKIKADFTVEVQTHAHFLSN